MFPLTLTTMKIFLHFCFFIVFFYFLILIYSFIFTIQNKTSASETEGKIKYYFSSTIFIMLLLPCSIFVHLKSATTSTFSVDKKICKLY